MGPTGEEGHTEAQHVARVATRPNPRTTKQQHQARPGDRTKTRERHTPMDEPIADDNATGTPPR